jgi:hypothetical protein
MKQINTIEQLNNLSNAILEKLSNTTDLSNMEIIFSVDRTTLNKINEELFHVCNPTSMELPEETDEILLEIKNIKFKYILNK